MFNLLQYIEILNLDPAKTKIHVIRGDNASKDWELAESNPMRKIKHANKHPNLLNAWANLSREERLLEAVRLETCWNDESRWTGADHVVVLLTVQAEGSPYRHVEDGFLLMGVLKVEGRRASEARESGGTFECPAWIMNWHIRRSDYLFVNPLMKKVPQGWVFWAAGQSENTRAASFVIHGRLDTTVGVPTPSAHRGFQLSFKQLQERIYMPNWTNFLRPAGVYLIQVFDPQQQEYFRYVGSAKSITSRWTAYAETVGCGGIEEEGNVYLVKLRLSMGDEAFLAHWRIQVIRNCDTDEVLAVERDTKRALCTYHRDFVGGEYDSYKSAFGLNGN